MTDFIITGPDGKKYKVTGDSAEGAVAALKKMLGAPTAAQAAAPSVASAPDGRTVAPGTTAAQAQDLPPGMVFDPQTGGYVDTALAAQRMGKAQGANANFLQGAPFVGEYADEALGAVDAAMTGRNPEIAQETMRQSRSQFQQSNPVLATGASIAGGLVGGAPLAAAAAPLAVAAAPSGLAAQAASGAVAGGALGAVEGAVSGYGRGTGEGRADEAVRGGLVGAVAGGVMGAAAPVVSRGMASLVERVKGMDTRQIAKALNISPKAAQILKADLDATDFAAARRNIDIAGPDAMLADASRPLREALDASITGGGAASRIGNDAVSARAAAAGKKLETVMDATLGKPQGIGAAARSIAQRTAPARAAAYKKAYNTPIDYSTGGAGETVLGVLDRIPSRTLNAAIQEANEAMQAQGIRNRQIMASVAPDGKVSFQEMPNVQQLDEIKKALGAVAAKEVDTFGRSTAAGNRAKGLARDLRDAIADAAPAYKTAVRLGGDKIEADQALDMGRKLFGPAVTREQVRDTMKDASLEAKESARQGVREYIDNTLARVRRSIDEPGEDTTETLRLLNTISTRDAREKLTVILGGDKAARLLREVDAAGKQFATRAAIATGSATGRREARRAAIDDALAPGIIGSAQQGLVGPTVRNVVQLLTRETPQAQMGRRQEALADVARALTAIRGKDAEAALVTIEKAMRGQPVKSAEAAKIGRLVAGSSALSGYQSAKQYQSSR
jgi:hypothetical protein